MEEFLNAQEWRYATKKYDASKKVSEADIEMLMEAVQLSVSSIGLQPYKVFIIESEAMRNELKAAAFGNNANLFADASHIFIFASVVNLGQDYVDSYMDNVGTVRNLSKEDLIGFSDYVSGYVGGLTNEQKNIWTAKQAYIALGNLINAAALMHIDTTPMEGVDMEKVNKILELDKLGLTASVVATVGYRHSEDATQHFKKVRKPKQELFKTI